MKQIFLLFFLSLLSFAKSFSQSNVTPAYAITSDTAYISIPDSCWQMMEDKKGNWTISQVSQWPVSENFHSKAKILYPSCYWVRFWLRNDLDHDAYVYFNSYGQIYDLYTAPKANSWQHEQTGFFVPWSKRNGVKNRYRLPTVVRSGQELLVYERFKFYPRLGTPEYFYPGIGFVDKMIRDNYVINESEFFDNMRQGIIFGIAILAAVFGFFFFLATRARVYFHASMLYLTIAGFSLIRGLGDLFFRENANAIAFYGQYFLIPPFLYFLVSTTRYSLETKRKSPRWDKFLAILSVTPFLWFVAQYFYSPFDKWGILPPMVIMGSVIISCLRFVPRNDITAQLLMTGVLVFAVFELSYAVTQVLNTSLPLWFQKHELDIEMVCFFWIIAVSSWILFKSYGQMQKKLLQEAFDREQLAKEREIERRQLIELQKLELEQQVSARTAELKLSLEELKSTQKQLVQSEKMASLGELTAGIAHEIQNPLNFVNNFSDVNIELVDEANQEINKGNIDEAKAILNDIKDNEQKINHHGKRADSIVRGMLQHSRTSSGQNELTDINKLADEYLRLAYHGLRAKDKSFNAEIKTDFDDSLQKINVVPEEIGRVLLNVINNAFYAVNERDKLHASGYKPQVIVGTKRSGDKVELAVKDNGNGIPGSIKEKIFQPFFTTKPTGQGTGLGLSLAYDIVKAHGGEIKVETEEGQGTEFTIVLHY